MGENEMNRVEEAKTGNKEAFSLLMKQYFSSMYRVARAILPTDEDCRDALQEAMLNAYTSMRKLRETTYFKTWLIRITINESRNILRKKKPWYALKDEEEVQSNEWLQVEEDVDQKMIVQEAMATLPEKMKIVIVLFYFEQFKIREIGEALQWKESTVKTRLSRAREQLRQELCPDRDGNVSIRRTQPLRKLKSFTSS